MRVIEAGVLLIVIVRTASTKASSLLQMPGNERSGNDLPLSGLTRDGWSNEDEATTTCACGAVQMVVVNSATCITV